MPRQARKIASASTELGAPSHREGSPKKRGTAISSFSRLPVNIDLTRLRQKQTEIIFKLHESGLSYQGIAALFDIDRGVHLSNYLTRKPRRINLANSEYIKRIHAKLIDPDNNLKSLLPADILADYQSLSNPHDEKVITFPKKTTLEPSPESMYAGSRILNNIFDVADVPAATDNIRRVKGTYYAYRSSSERGEIVKSFIEIREPSLPGSYFDFEHFHPDRIYDSERGDEPRRTHGFVFSLNNNLFLIGNTENGRTLSLFGIREPFAKEFHNLLGYNLTTNMDRILFATLMVFVKDPDAHRGGIGRFGVNKFEEHKPGFKKELLENTIDKGDYICRLLSDVRAKADRV
jgi:hypothetical protein